MVATFIFEIVSWDIYFTFTAALHPTHTHCYCVCTMCSAMPSLQKYTQRKYNRHYCVAVREYIFFYSVTPCSQCFALDLYVHCTLLLKKKKIRRKQPAKCAGNGSTKNVLRITNRIIYEYLVHSYKTYMNKKPSVSIWN